MTNVMPTARTSPPPPFGEIHGHGEQHEHGDRQPDRELADELDGRLGSPELIRLHDHDAAGVGTETLLDLLLGQADTVGQLLDERLDVEDESPSPVCRNLPRRRRCE